MVFFLAVVFDGAVSGDAFQVKNVASNFYAYYTVCTERLGCKKLFLSGVFGKGTEIQCFLCFGVVLVDRNSKFKS